MSGFLKQSTASQTRWIGPFIDDTDFKTAETALTIANTDIKVSKNGGASASKNSGGGTHDVNGMYAVTWDATDTATVGELKYSVKVAGALQVIGVYTVVEEAVYDMLFGASAVGYINNAPVNVAQFGGSNGTFASGRPEVNMTHIAGSAVSTSTAQLGVNVVNFGGSAGTFASGVPAVNATQISGDSTAADNLETAYDDTAGAVPWTGVIDQGTAQSVSSSTIVLRSAAAFVDDALNGCTVVITNGTQIGERAIITDYVGATDTATVTWPGATPSGTPTYKIFGSAAGASLADIADAVWDEATSGHTTAGTTGKALTDASSAGDPWSTALPGAYGSGTAGKIIGDNINATISSRASQTSLDTLDDYVDTEVAAIKAKTDNLPSDPADASDIATSFTTVNTKLDTIDDFLDTEIAAIKAKTDNLPSDPADASDIASSFTTVNTKLDTIDDFLDTEVAAIKAKTDSLTFTVAGAVDANVQRVNDVNLQGAGTSGDKWRPA